MDIKYKDMNITNLTGDEEERSNNEKAMEKYWKDIHQGNIIIAEFLGYKYYPKVEGETHPGVWCVNTREKEMKEYGSLEHVINGSRFWISSLCSFKGYAAFLGRNRKSINFHQWERIMSVARHVEQAGGKVELTTDLHKTFMNVVEAIKKLEICQ